MTTPFSQDVLTTCVLRHVPYKDGDVTFSRIPTGKFNTSYLVHIDHQELILRIAPPQDAVFVFYEKDMMKQEPGIHRLLLEKTDVPVANIVAFDDSRDLLDRDFLLMEYLPGTPLSSSFGVDEDSCLFQVGQSLAQVHRLTAEQYGYLGEHHPMPPQSTWNEAFQVMWRKLIEDVVTVGYYTQEEANWLLSLLEKYLPLFDRESPSSLLHMDIWRQNILVDTEGNLSGIVDWDRALWGDPEIEFAVLDYCGISQPAFWEGYGTPRDTSPAAQVRRVFYLLYEIQKYIVIRHGRNHHPAEAQQYKQQVMHIVRQYL